MWKCEIELSDAACSALTFPFNIANGCFCNNKEFLNHLGVCELMKEDICKSK
jgi:hypothetical protein